MRSWLSVLGVAILATCATAAPVVVFSDDFGTSRGANFDKTGVIGTSTVWSVEPVNGDGGAKIRDGVLQLTNDSGSDSNGTGIVRVWTDITKYAPGYQGTLDNSSDVVEWTFNMRQPWSDPGQLVAGNYGVAYVLAANGNGFFSSANGYAVMLGSSSDKDAVTLVRLNGSSAFTTLITATAPLDDIGSEHLSLRVRFDKTTKSWSLYGRNDGAAFANPKSGNLTLLGTTTDSSGSRHTDSYLPYTGMIWTYSTAANQTATFDNLTVAIVPEPGMLALVGGIGLAIARRRVR